MKKVAVMMSVMLFIMFLAAVSFAQMGRGGGSRGMGGQSGGRGTEKQVMKPSLDLTNAIPDFALMDLNLTREQASKINFLRDTLLNVVKVLQEETLKKRGDLRLMLHENSPDQGKISTMQKEIKDLQDQMRFLTSRYLQEVRNNLTSEQRTMLRPYWTVWDSGYN
jgi:Spy/CpxP family protein refolding chaperone